MEETPVVIVDDYHQKQVDRYLTPLRGGSDVTYKTFKYSYNHSDKERIEVTIFSL